MARSHEPAGVIIRHARHLRSEKSSAEEPTSEEMLIIVLRGLFRARTAAVLKKLRSQVSHQTPGTGNQALIQRGFEY